MRVKDDGRYIWCLEQPLLSFLFLLSLSRPVLDTVLFLMRGREGKCTLPWVPFLVITNENKKTRLNSKGMKEGKEGCQEKTQNALTFFIHFQVP